MCLTTFWRVIQCNRNSTSNTMHYAKCYSNFEAHSYRRLRDCATKLLVARLFSCKTADPVRCTETGCPYTLVLVLRGDPTVSRLRLARVSVRHHSHIVAWPQVAGTNEPLVWFSNFLHIGVSKNNTSMVGIIKSGLQCSSHFRNRVTQIGFSVSRTGIVTESSSEDLAANVYAAVTILETLAHAQMHVFCVSFSANTTCNFIFCTGFLLSVNISAA